MVLVCDDTMSIRRLLRINLELEGFEVIEACDGAAALLVLQGLDGSGRLPGAIVLDAQMSPRDGWWALERIRSMPSLDGIPIVMATAIRAFDDPSAMRTRGIDACVQKPFDPDVLVELIDGFVREGRSFVSPMW